MILIVAQKPPMKRKRYEIDGDTSDKTHLHSRPNRFPYRKSLRDRTMRPYRVPVSRPMSIECLHRWFGAAEPQEAVWTNSDWNSLRAKLERGSIVDTDGHRLWVGLTSKCIKGTLALTYKRAYHVPHVWWWISENKRFPDANMRFHKDCDRKQCISHFEPGHIHITSVMDMTDGDYMRACVRLDQNSIVQPNGCRIWTKRSQKDTGYGNMSFGLTSRRVHVWAYELAYRTATTPGLVVRHLCGNRLCIEPLHLKEGTHSENAQDRTTHGTMIRGEHHKNCKITETQAQMVIDSYKKGQTQKQRAAAIGVSMNVIRGIDHLGAWSHLMTDEQKAERRSGKGNPRINLELARKIKQSRNDERKLGTAARAAIFGVSPGTVRRIDRGEKWKAAGLSEVEYEKEQAIESERYDESIKRIIQSHVDIVPDVKDVTQSHWLWKRAKKAGGYGTISYHKKSCSVHVIAWCLWNKSLVPDGYVVRHKCPFKHCCNPDCLEIGTEQENALDKQRDGTQPNFRGANHPRAKMTEADALGIKNSFGQGTATSRAERFGVSKSVVHSIDSHRSWKHLPT